MTIGVSLLSAVVSGISGKTRVPSDNSLNIRFTEMTPAAPVKADRSAPTYPGVAFARDV